MTDFIIQNRLIFALLVCVLLDILTGLIKAIKTKKLKSSTFRNGGFKKILILLVVCLCYGLDTLFFSYDILFTSSVTYYIINESISILENVGRCGVPLPSKIKEILYNLKEND